MHNPTSLFKVNKKVNTVINRTTSLTMNLFLRIGKDSKRRLKPIWQTHLHKLEIKEDLIQSLDAHQIRSCSIENIALDQLTVLIDNLRLARATNPLFSKHLLVQSQQQQHQKKVGNIFKVKNEDTKTTSMASP